DFHVTGVQTCALPIFLKAVEGAEDDRAAGAHSAEDLGADDVAFGIAASGRTPWVLGALARAKEAGSATLGLACVPRPELASFARSEERRVGKERGYRR